MVGRGGRRRVAGGGSRESAAQTLDEESELQTFFSVLSLFRRVEPRGLLRGEGRELLGTHAHVFCRAVCGRHSDAAAD